MEEAKLSYYQRNKEHVRERAKEYYRRVSEGKVTRRNRDRNAPPPEKKPRGRPRKVTPPDTPPINAGDAYKSPDNQNDIIFEDLRLE